MFSRSFRSMQRSSSPTLLPQASSNPQDIHQSKLQLKRSYWLWPCWALGGCNWANSDGARTLRWQKCLHAHQVCNSNLRKLCQQLNEENLESKMYQEKIEKKNQHFGFFHFTLKFIPFITINSNNLIAFYFHFIAFCSLIPKKGEKHENNMNKLSYVCAHKKAFFPLLEMSVHPDMRKKKKKSSQLENCNWARSNRQ